jgi:hypothetical protein
MTGKSAEQALVHLAANDMVCLRLSLSSGERGPVYWPHKSLAVKKNDHVILCRARCIRQIRFDLWC